jgi:hypothetical protein
LGYEACGASCEMSVFLGVSRTSTRRWPERCTAVLASVRQSFAKAKDSAKGSRHGRVATGSPTNHGTLSRSPLIQLLVQRLAIMSFAIPSRMTLVLISNEGERYRKSSFSASVLVTREFLMRDGSARENGRDLELVMARAVCDWLGSKR